MPSPKLGLPATIQTLPVELYRPIVEHVAGRRDLVALCLVCHFMRDEAERVIFQVVKLMTSDQHLGKRLMGTPRLRQHVQRLGIAKEFHCNFPRILPPLIRRLVNNLVALDLWDMWLGPQFYAVLADCRFERLKEFRCTFPDQEHSNVVGYSARQLSKLHMYLGTFFNNHPTIEKLFWKGDGPNGSDLGHMIRPGTLPRLRYLDGETRLVLPLLGSARPMTHLSIADPKHLPPPQFVASMVHLTVFEAYTTFVNPTVMQVLELAPQLKFFGTVDMGHNKATRLLVHLLPKHQNLMTLRTTCLNFGDLPYFKKALTSCQTLKTVWDGEGQSGIIRFDRTETDWDFFFVPNLSHPENLWKSA